MNQSNLLKNSIELNDRSRRRTTEGKDKKRNNFECVIALYKGRKLILNAFKSGIFPATETQRKGF